MAPLPASQCRGRPCLDEVAAPPAVLVHGPPQVLAENAHHQQLRPSDHQQRDREPTPSLSTMASEGVDHDFECIEEAEPAGGEAEEQHQSYRQVAEDCEGVDRELELLAEAPSRTAVSAAALQVGNSYLPEAHSSDQHREVRLALGETAQRVDHQSVKQETI